MVPEERPLQARDIEGCLRLVAEAGWNQTENDWLTILEIGEARGLFRQGQLIATAAIVRHGPIGWICMVLVQTTEQRQGLATHLLKWAVQRLDEIGLTPGLDATPAGREVYLKLGFEDIYGVTRLQCDKPRTTERRLSGSPPRSIGRADLEAISQFGPQGIRCRPWGSARQPHPAPARSRFGDIGGRRVHRLRACARGPQGNADRTRRGTRWGDCARTFCRLC